MKRPYRGGLAIRSAAVKEAAEENPRLRVLKSMAIGAFPDTDSGREAMEIHAEMLKEAYDEEKK